MSLPEWYLAIGAVLCVMALAATFIRRSPLSTSVFYLPLGWALGPYGFGVLTADLVRDGRAIEIIAQTVILISLFSAGLKIRVPHRSRLWLLSLRLVGPAMILTVAIIAAAAVSLLDFSWGAAILLGGMLAPTDPVLASDVQIEDPFDIKPLRFALTSEAGLNDGAAFPFVTLGLLWLAAPLTPPAAWRWLGVDVAWGVGSGLAAGIALALLIGNWVLHLREAHRQAVGLGYFLAPGIIALAYGLGEAVRGYGFLSVFAAGVTLRSIELQRDRGIDPEQLPLITADRSNVMRAATNPETAPLFLVEFLLQFTMQLEQLGELMIVTIVGALLTRSSFAAPVLLFAVLIIAAIRPAAVAASLGGTMRWPERLLIGWFGIRGIGSVYYLVYALGHGAGTPAIARMGPIVLAAIAVSVCFHGITVTPLMDWYARRERQQ